MNTKIKFYKVGGCVRDQILGIKAKDIDYCVVIENFNGDIDDAYNLLCKYLNENNYTIFLKTPSCFTVRAKCNKTHQVRDFVLARKELNYNDDTRSPIVTLGTLHDDLTRRDFTINALAMDDETDEIIDVCNGLNDLGKGILRTPLDPIITLTDDPLRVLRGFRFSITKNFKLDENFVSALTNDKIWTKMTKVVSIERIREELDKMFKHDTIKTLEFLSLVKNINYQCYEFIANGILLKPVVRLNN
ncbi:tRNA nucleotidyltransferase/poly(A) polymerase [Tupanvirus deep ocean]|uniref:tRNA nucleotidyltransferase/poly(A) polymerase n=2 Tax=Tupanvirus TaxID=2094720 RepID=A0AC62A8H0_9VIRU|nr:tRNA nucleotidyltransferase/poly(A) polymerase [Tupanvirus deep ocean]QKU34066.1 tRNA nucleotidyltransferase/poly(A) polymerase [Tupanvirus deep ocean]